MHGIHKTGRTWRFGFLDFSAWFSVVHRNACRRAQISDFSGSGPYASRRACQSRPECAPAGKLPEGDGSGDAGTVEGQRRGLWGRGEISAAGRCQVSRGLPVNTGVGGLHDAKD